MLLKIEAKKAILSKCLTNKRLIINKLGNTLLLLLLLSRFSHV